MPLPVLYKVYTSEKIMTHNGAIPVRVMHIKADFDSVPTEEIWRAKIEAIKSIYPKPKGKVCNKEVIWIMNSGITNRISKVNSVYYQI